MPRTPRTNALLTPVASHAFEFTNTHAVFNQYPVELHKTTAFGIGLLSRVSLNVCEQYQIEYEDPALFAPTSRLRIVSCRQNQNGLFQITAQLCEQQLRARAA